MHIVTFRSVRTTPGTCSCCGRSCRFLIRAYDLSTLSEADFCFQCYHFLLDIQIH